MAILMPLYGFKCQCGREEDLLMAIADRNKEVTCEGCESIMTRIITANIERVEPTWLGSMKQMLPPKEREGATDRHSFNQALDRSGLVCI